MAKNKGPLKLSGSLGEITFRDTREGNIASQKSSLTRERVRTDPAFERSRLAAQTFKQAACAAGLIRRTFLPLLTDCTDTRFAGRLTARVRKIIQEDSENRAGEQLGFSDLTELVGFECNKLQSFSAVCYLGLNINHKISEQKLNITVAGMKANADSLPVGITHWQGQLAVGIVNFHKGTSRLLCHHILPFTGLTETLGSLSPIEISTDTGIGKCVLGLIAFRPFTQQGSAFYPLKDKRKNAATVFYAKVI